MSRHDTLTWGVLFSVKSAYKVGIVLRDRRSGLEASSSDSRSAPRSPFDWNHIGQLKATSKVKMFVWRLAHNSLAHRMKILNLGVDLDTKCPICNRHNEDGCHVFLKCKKSKTCWSILGLGELREKLSLCTSSRDLIQVHVGMVEYPKQGKCW
jgi:hypothetical protein